MSAWRGRCHCGALGFEYRTEKPPGEWPVRACQCSFCRKHGAVCTSDPAGSVRFMHEDPTLLARYRFAVSAAGVEGDKAEQDLGARWDGGSQLTDPVAEILARFFPERLSPDVEKALRSSASGDARLLAAGCLQLPEHQFF